MTTNQPHKETVIIVHGTFAAPKDGETQWYQLGTDPTTSGSFVQQLDSELEKAGSSARCWAHCNHPSEIFTWSGENSWDARYRASIKLADELIYLIKSEWKIHIVAHSHGGNVLIDAIKNIEYRNCITNNILSLTTVGTPFIHDNYIEEYINQYNYTNIRSFYDKFKFKAETFTLASAITSFWFLDSMVSIMGATIGPFTGINYKSLIGIDSENYSLIVIVLIFIYIAAYYLVKLLIYSLRPIVRRIIVYRRVRLPIDGSLIKRKAINYTNKYSSLLCINNEFDEAWMLLHHIVKIKDPLYPKITPLNLILENLKNSFQRKQLKFEVLGAKVHNNIVMRTLAFIFVNPITFGILISFCMTSPLLFFSFFRSNYNYTYALLFCFIFILFLFHVNFIAPGNLPILQKNYEHFRYYFIFTEIAFEFPQIIITYCLKRRIWNYFISLAFGNHDYFTSVPSVDMTPRNLLCIYENIPSAALDHALRKRRKWLSKYFDKAENLFKQTIISDGQMIELLKSIERDQSLVHSVYYTHLDCINQIASWIISKKHDDFANSSK